MEKKSVARTAAQKVMSSVIIAKKLHLDAKLEMTKERYLSYLRPRLLRRTHPCTLVLSTGVYNVDSENALI